ncbi:MAG TPA: M14 family metallopeptidase [Candidatus Acidoferrales bacterium]|nr:M14 family metallopeptidase [Candidatus Acidoferrales bacterium]
MRLFPALLLAAICARAADVSVGTATAGPGQRVTGAIQVPRGVDAASDVPVIVINGARPGPMLALVAGAHGTEYASIVALHKLARSVDPAALAGAVVIAPLLNTASFSQVVPHLNPVDGKNMNRFYPGKPDGSQTERVSWAVTKQVIEKCDYLIDLHGGDLDENLRSYAYWADTGKDTLDATTRGMVLAFGLDHIIVQRARTAPAPGAPVTITRYAQTIGKPAIAAEAGHAGTVMPEDVDILVEGSLNVMRHLKMLPGTVSPVERPVWIANATVVAADREGVFYPLAKPEAYVAKGMRIGYVTDYFGEKVADVTAPVSGVIIYIRAIPSLKKGDNLADIGEIVANP